MSELRSERSRTLSAVDVIYPQRGDVLRVDEGEVLVFTPDELGRRIPVVTVRAGELLVGCGTADGPVGMLASGVNGTRVTVLDMQQAPVEDLLAWVRRLAGSVADGGWPQKIISIDDASSMVSPGEHIASDDDGDVAWVHLTGGSAQWCDGATISPDDPVMPLLPGSWLTAGLRCRVRRAAEPGTPEQWSDSLDLAARLALATAVSRRQRDDADAVDRLEARTLASDAAAAEAVQALTGAVGGERVLPILSDQQHTAELSAAVTVAQATGLTVSDEAVLRAGSEVESGRDPISAIAAVCDARPRPVRLRSDWWSREGNAMFVQVSASGSASRSPAAVVWRRRGWMLIDAAGTETAVNADVAQSIDRSAVELLPVLPSAKLGLRDLLKLSFVDSRRELVVILGITAVLALMSFITPYLLGQVANLFVADASMSAFAGLFVALFLVVVASTSFQAVRSLAMLRARSKASAVGAGALWERVMRQKATWHARYTLGERNSQASAVNNASESMPDETVAQLLDVSLIVGSLAAIATTNITMLFALGALLLVQAVITGVLLRTSSRRAKVRFDASSAATSRLLEIMKSVNRLRVAGAESRAFLRWAQAQAPFSRADQDLRKVAMLQSVVMAVWPLLSLVVIVFVTSTTGAGFGAFVTAQTAVSGAMLAVASMTASGNAALVAKQSMAQAIPVMESIPEGGLDGVPPGIISGGIEARDLVFRYAPDLPAVLDRVSLRVRPGEQVAIVGPSGCGKTTLMRVLLGLEEPDSGIISVDGRDLASLNRPAVRRQIGSVLQSSSLLPGSIKENIDMGRGLTAPEVWEALEVADLAKDVQALAMGIETPVTDGGGTLSGGQRQRVLIARAMAGQPRMLILDEATSALDNVTQAAVVDALEKLRITRIVVAHRLSTIRHADRIIVMDAGRVVDEGTFDELVAKPGPFRELAQRQSA